MIFEVSKGQHFYGGIIECKAEIKRSGRKYMIMRFNELDITVSHDSNSDDLATIYDLKHKLRQKGF